MWPFSRRSSAPAMPPGDGGELDVTRHADAAATEFVHGARRDGWLNEVMAIGTSRDKASFTHFQCESVNDEEARELWEGEDLAATIIETIVDDATRNGFMIEVADDKELGEDIHTAICDLGGDMMLGDARKRERAFGGSAIFPIANDGGLPSEPLRMDRIASVDSLVLLEPRELVAIDWYREMTDRKFRMPRLYRCSPYVPQSGTIPQIIHESRLIILPGRRVSNLTIGRNRNRFAGWGESELTPIKRVLTEFNLSFSAAQRLLNDFAQMVFKMTGLVEALALDAKNKTTSGRQGILRRIAELDFYRSVNRLAPIDAGDQLERQATPVTGLADLLTQITLRLAAAAKMPVTKLMGQSPAGMNATGEHDQDNWDDKAKGEQTWRLTPPGKQLAVFVMSAHNGPTRGKLPKSWRWKWQPLRQPTALEEAQARYYVAQADEIYVGKLGAASLDELAMSRWGGGRYSADMHIDFEARARQQAAADRAAAAAARAEQSQPPAPSDEQPAIGDAPAQPAKPAAGVGPSNIATLADLRASAQGARARRANDTGESARMPTRFRYDAIEVAAQSNDGVMVALYLPSDIAAGLAMKGGERAEDLHVTLAYLGRDLPEIAVQRAIGVAYDLAVRTPPVAALIAGIGRFSASETSGGKDVIYASIDSPAITELRSCLCQRLCWESVPVSMAHGFTPHVTLAYVATDARSPVARLEPISVTFGAIVVAAGDAQVVLPFTGKPEMAPADQRQYRDEIAIAAAAHRQITGR
jgi:phage-related protein (TIGR01555 family)